MGSKPLLVMVQLTKKIDNASRIPPRRPRTLRTWLGSARNFGNTRFGRFAIFDFLTPKKKFENNFRSNFFFGFFVVVLSLGGLVGTHRDKAEHVMSESHFERRASNTKRLHHARTKTRSEDHATLF